MYAKWTRFSDFSDSISDRGTNIILTAFSSESGSCNSSVTLTPNKQIFQNLTQSSWRIRWMKKGSNGTMTSNGYFRQDKSRELQRAGTHNDTSRVETRVNIWEQSWNEGWKWNCQPSPLHFSWTLGSCQWPVTTLRPSALWDAVCLREKREVAKPNWSRMCFRPHGELHTQGPCSVSCHPCHLTTPLPSQTQRDYCQGMETFRRVVTIFKEHGELHSGPMQCIKREHNLVSDPPLSNVSQSEFVKSLEVWRHSGEINVFLRSMESSTTGPCNVIMIWVDANQSADQ